MSKIKLLDKDISELIAAGEVIERPASVIKELAENAIDAGAKHITIEIKKGGTTYIRIADDGSGMEYEDVPMAFKRHATSKVSDKNDLEKILTFGFRGEALASVSAVAKVDVMTKRAEDEYGTHYAIEGSEEKIYEKTGCPDGTTIFVRNLFFNVPVRRNFMKKDSVEANAVSKVVQKTALSHPEVAFKFIRDGKIDFASSGDGNLHSAIYAVYGKEFAEDLLPVDFEYEFVKVRGFIVKPLYSKTNRLFQNFFINGRHVKSVICQTAIESAYNMMLMSGRFPACVLMIDIPPASIDVNIHPSKAEVRFSDDKVVSDALYFCIKDTMVKNGLLYEFQFKRDDMQDSDSPENLKEEQETYTSIFTNPDDIDEREQMMFTNHKDDYSPNQFKIPDENPVRAKVVNVVIDDDDDDDDYSEEELRCLSERIKSKVINFEEISKKQENHNQEASDEKIEGFNYISNRSFKEKKSEIKQEFLPNFQEDEIKIHVIGEAFKNYIMAEADNTIVMIDKHAAHERIIFERLKSENCRQYMQMTLNDSRILLSEEEFAEMESNAERLENMGFSFDYSQKPYIIPKGIPSFLISLNMDDIIPEIADNFVKYSHDPQTHAIDDILHTMACKSAIKANDNNDISELQKLAEEVYGNKNIRHCPHGRPVMFTMTKDNIEKQFKRKL
ncbi:MAG: DNA mismatch repair endonuclease MutL [Oscillospiraceae bacterium]|nr:DNA mismatch repair endonuclease MutL [Oscillospiraceae bacterium]